MLFLASKETTAPELVTSLKGGPGSGFHGHAGRPGKRGGSSSDGSGAEAPLSAGQIGDLMAKRAREIQAATLKKYGRSHSQKEVDDLRREATRNDPEMMRLMKHLNDLRSGHTPPPPTRLADLPKPPRPAPPVDPTPKPTARPASGMTEGMSAEMAKIDDLRQTFLEQSQLGSGENRDRLTEEQRAFLSTMSGKPRLTDKMDTSKTKREITENWRRTALLRLFGDGKGSTLMPVVTGGEPWEKHQANHHASVALEFLGQLANTIPEGEITVALSALKRANYEDGTINMGPKDSIETYVHEIGHFLEDKGMIDGSPIWHLAADELERRTAKSERIVIERKQTKTGKAVEVTSRPDHFMHPYVGRDYKPDKATGKKRHTELLAMGVGYLWSNPHRLAAEDPQLFNFTMAMLKGVKP